MQKGHEIDNIEEMITTIHTENNNAKINTKAATSPKIPNDVISGQNGLTFQNTSLSWQLNSDQ